MEEPTADETAPVAPEQEQEEPAATDEPVSGSHEQLQEEGGVGEPGDLNAPLSPAGVQEAEVPQDSDVPQQLQEVSQELPFDREAEHGQEDATASPSAVESEEVAPPSNEEPQLDPQTLSGEAGGQAGGGGMEALDVIVADEQAENTADEKLLEGGSSIDNTETTGAAEPNVMDTHYGEQDSKEDLSNDVAQQQAMQSSSDQQGDAAPTAGAEHTEEAVETAAEADVAAANAAESAQTGAAGAVEEGVDKQAVMEGGANEHHAAPGMAGDEKDAPAAEPAEVALGHGQDFKASAEFTDSIIKHQPNYSQGDSPGRQYSPERDGLYRPESPLSFVRSATPDLSRGTLMYRCTSPTQRFRTKAGRELSVEQLQASIERLNSSYGSPPPSEASSRPESAYFNFSPKTTLKITKDDEEALVTRLYTPKPVKTEPPPLPKPVKLAYRSSDKGPIETWEPIKSAPDAERTAALQELYNRCLESRKKTEEELAAKYLQPLGKSKK